MAIPTKTAECLYMLNSYSLEGKATVTGFGLDPKYGRFVLLNQTHFHPQGGGQLSDVGTIGEVAIKHVSKAPIPDAGPHAFDVRHHYEAEADLFIEGTPVEYTVNRERRTTAMHWHASGHLLAAVAEELFPQLQAVNAHHFPGEARVEFQLRESGAAFPSADEIKTRLPSAYADAVKEGKAVDVKMGPPRTVQYGDYPAVPCGGTHVANTSELPEELSIRSAKAKKGKLSVGYDLPATGK